jgi:hypothetical protein
MSNDVTELPAHLNRFADNTRRAIPDNNLHRSYKRHMISSLLKANERWGGVEELAPWTLETLVLTQKHLVYGEQTVFFNRNSIRIDGRRTGLSIIAMAPDWDVFVCNLNTRKAYRTTAHTYRSQVSHLLGAFEPGSEGASTIVKQAFTRSFAARLCHCWQTSPALETNAKQLFNRGIVAANFPKQIEIWATDAQMSDTQRTLLSRFYGIPVVPGVPLHVSYKKIDGRSALLLDTSTCAVQVLPSSFFRFPKHCSVTTETDFCRSALSAEYLLN